MNQLQRGDHGPQKTAAFQILATSQQTEPLGIELKTACCPETKLMTRMEIQRGFLFICVYYIIVLSNLTDLNTFVSIFTGKEGIKTESYYYELGATAGCTLRLGVGTNALPRSRSTFIGNACFGSIKAAAATVEKGIEGIYLVKSNYGLYPKGFIEDSLEEAPGETHIVMQGTHPY